MKGRAALRMWPALGSATYKSRLEAMCAGEKNNPARGRLSTPLFAEGYHRHQRQESSTPNQRGAAPFFGLIDGIGEDV